jgi:hypothetical protein
VVRSLQNEAEPDGATNPRSTADRQPGREGAEEETHGKNHLRTSARPDLKRWGGTEGGLERSYVSPAARAATVPPSPYLFITSGPLVHSIVGVRLGGASRPRGTHTQTSSVELR